MVIEIILFAVHSKQSSFWPKADVKHMQNGLVHVMPSQCMLALCKCILQSLCSNGTAHFKNVNNCLNTNICSYLETSGGQSYSLYLTVVLLFNTSVN